MPRFHVTASWWVEDADVTTPEEAVNAIENAVAGSKVSAELDDSECDDEEEDSTTPIGAD